MPMALSCMRQRIPLNQNVTAPRAIDAAINEKSHSLTIKSYISARSMSRKST